MRRFVSVLLSVGFLPGGPEGRGFETAGLVAAAKVIAVALVAFGLVVSNSPQAFSDTLTVFGPTHPTFSAVPWTATATSGFSVPYARLNGITYSVYAAAEIQQVLSNGSNSTTFQSLNGHINVDVLANGNKVGSVQLAPSVFAVIPPHSSTNYAGFDEKTTQPLPLPLSTNPVTYALRAILGDGPSPMALAEMSITYSYMPIGLSQDDPILPASDVNGLLTFPAVPSGRWFDPPAASAYEYQITSAGDVFSSINSFPTGFTGTFSVHAGGADLGHFRAGQSVHFSPGVTSFIVSDIHQTNGQGASGEFPIALAFNRNGVTFTAHPITVPEPTGMCLLLIGGALLAGFRATALAMR